MSSRAQIPDTRSAEARAVELGGPCGGAPKLVAAWKRLGQCKARGARAGGPEVEVA